VHVSLSSKKEHCSPGSDEDWQKFRALMDALAFVHGTHAWPYRVEYWHSGRKVTDRVTAAEKLGRTAHAPFNEALEFNARAGKVEWDYLGTLKIAAAFFEQDSALRKEVASILFLFREADNAVHSEITTLAMCPLFENLLNLIFRELKLGEKALIENRGLNLFERARHVIDRCITQKVRRNKEKEGYERWQKIVSGAQLFTAREKLQAIVNYFGLKWEGDLELVFKTWQKARNPLVHSTRRADRTEDQFKEISSQ